MKGANVFFSPLRMGLANGKDNRIHVNSISTTQDADDISFVELGDPYEDQTLYLYTQWCMSSGDVGFGPAVYGLREASVDLRTLGPTADT